MDKQFQRLVELQKKKDAGTITKSEQTRLDKLTARYIRKCGNAIKLYQEQLVKLNNQLLRSSLMLEKADKALKEAIHFLEEKGLLEEFKALNKQD